jgi:hypothetical protein
VALPITTFSPFFLQEEANTAAISIAKPIDNIFFILFNLLF